MMPATATATTTASLTSWTVVWNAGHATTRRQRAALEELCSVYWFPVYSFIRKRGSSAHDAEDLTQGFFASLIRQKWFAKVNPDRGRLRTFLFSTLINFLNTEYQRATAKKRGGGVEIVSLDGAEQRYLAEPQDPVTPEKIFQRRWVQTLLENALLDLKNEYAASGRELLFEALREHLNADAEECIAQSQVGADLSMSPNALRTAICRMRSRFRDHLYKHVAATISSRDEDAIRAEIRELLDAL